jgi:hypothetical protein
MQRPRNKHTTVCTYFHKWKPAHPHHHCHWCALAYYSINYYHFPHVHSLLSISSLPTPPFRLSLSSRSSPVLFNSELQDPDIRRSRCWHIKPTPQTNYVSIHRRLCFPPSLTHTIPTMHHPLPFTSHLPPSTCTSTHPNPSPERQQYQNEAKRDKEK